MSFAIDSSHGWLHVRPGDLQTPGDADRYRDALLAEAARLRGRGAAVLILVDASGSSVHGAEVADRLKHLDDELIEAEGDRIAIVVQHNVQKMQVRRIRSSAQSEVFASVSEARSWLGV